MSAFDELRRVRVRDVLAAIDWERSQPLGCAVMGVPLLIFAAWGARLVGEVGAWIGRYGGNRRE